MQDHRVIDRFDLLLAADIPPLAVDQLDVMSRCLDVFDAGEFDQLDEFTQPSLRSLRCAVKFTKLVRCEDAADGDGVKLFLHFCDHVVAFCLGFCWS